MGGKLYYPLRQTIHIIFLEKHTERYQGERQPLGFALYRSREKKARVWRPELEKGLDHKVSKISIQAEYGEGKGIFIYPSLYFYAVWNFHVLK